MSTLLDLASRVEGAEGPDRELDAAIGVAIGLPTEDRTGQRGWHGEYFTVGLPSYTASLDAAMTLVPEGWAWMCGCAADDGFFATLSPTDESGIDADMIDTLAPTTALALVSACLRARAADTPVCDDRVLAK